MHLPAVIGRRAVIITSLARFAAAAPRSAVIPVNVVDGRCVVPVIFDGRAARMILDTGAERTVITETAARKLGLTFDRWVDTTLRDAGGRLVTHSNANVSAATLGGLPLYQRPGTRSLSLSVAGSDLGGADGLVGGDLLGHFTLGLDVPHARLSLSLADGGAAISHGINLQRLWPDLLLAPVVLDGCRLAALVDTGSTASVINARGLYRLRLTPERLARDKIVPLNGIDGRLPARLHRFANLHLGSVTITCPELLAADLPEAGFDLILGMDVLGLQSLRLSYPELKLAFPGA